jgi:hypothetical protein
MDRIDAELEARPVSLGPLRVKATVQKHDGLPVDEMIKVLHALDKSSDVRDKRVLFFFGFVIPAMQWSFRRAGRTGDAMAPVIGSCL